MKKGLRDMAARSILAEDNFVSTLEVLGRITRPEAERVFRYYVKHKLVKRDLVNAVYNVKHGSFLDREVIEEAVRLTKGK